MTPSPSTLVEDFYRSLHAGERDYPGFFHPEVEWHWPPDTPGAGVYRGYEGLEYGFGVWVESWGAFEMQPEEFLEEGHDVLAFVRYRVRGAGSGIDIEHLLAHLMRLEDGVIREWWMFGDADKARRRFLAGDRPG